MSFRSAFTSAFSPAFRSSYNADGGGGLYVTEGLVLDYSTDVGPLTIVDKSDEGNTATLQSGRGLTMDAVNDTVTYATGYGGGESLTATVWMRVTSLGVRTLNSAGGVFNFTPTATNVWEQLSSTTNPLIDLTWTAGSDCDIGDLVIGTEHWTHNDWSDPTGDTSNGKTIVDSGPNQLHGTCTGCSGFTGEGMDPEFLNIVGYDDSHHFPNTSTSNIRSPALTQHVGMGVIGSELELRIFPTSLVSTSHGAVMVSNASSGTTRCLSFRTVNYRLRLTLGGFTSGVNAIEFSTIRLTDLLQKWSVIKLKFISGGVEAYLNGVLKQTSTWSNPSTSHSTYSMVGSASNTGSGFTGVIDYVSTNGVQHFNKDTVVTNSNIRTVGQNRATIPQTADKNWNKYIGLGAAESGSSGYSTLTPVPYGFDATLASGPGIAGFTLPATAQIGDSFKIRVDITSDQSPTCQFRASSGSSLITSNSLPLSVGSNEITLTMTAAGDFIAISEGDAPSTLTVRNFTAELISGTAQASVMVSASDANDQIDVLGTAISEPRLNTQQVNIFGEGEHSFTSDSSSLDLTTTATWEIWGNFYGVPASNASLFSKYDATSGKRSWGFFRPTGDAADTFRLNFGDPLNGTFEGAAKWGGLTDSVSQLVVTYNAGTLKAYLNSVDLGAHSVEAGAVPSSIYVSTTDVIVGGQASGSGIANVFDRKIGSAKIYNVALTADEVLTNYNTQKSKYGL